MKNCPEWDALQLRSFLGYIYTVRTVNPEIFGERNQNVKMDKVREYFEPVFAWLLEWNLSEVMIPEPLEYIENSESYLLRLAPNPKLLTLNYMMATLVIYTFLFLFGYCVVTYLF